ncbi:hypothetical protein F4780DRAFT_691351 [Xylariomycetidae sp. FL0641]|nr:hypothetical protein F4780DRAFT_691351 [Xylariomycetidae sp. FL0641]
MQILPCVRVQDLPPAASFYSAVTQPLGLRYLSANSSSIVFGDKTGVPEPIFEVRTSGQPVRPSRIVLSASSPSVVSAFWAAALRAHPDLHADGSCGLIDGSGAPGSGETRARITDLEGNIMEVVYVNPPDYPPNYTGSTVRKTQSTSHEVTRILDWNLDVATTAGVHSLLPSRAEQPISVVKRTITSSTIETPVLPPSQEETPSGYSTGVVVGSILGGLAAGAAIGGVATYAMMRADRERAPKQEYDSMPSFQRRATFPDPYPDHRPSYVEVERTVERIHYPPSASRKYPPSATPSFVARYSQAPPSRVATTEDTADEDHRSHHTMRSRSRRRSETGSTRRPLMLTEHEHRSSSGSSKSQGGPKLLMDADHTGRSHAGSRHTANVSRMYSEMGDEYSEASRQSSATVKYGSGEIREGRSRANSKHSSRHHREPENETYLSARSDRTVRANPAGVTPIPGATVLATAKAPPRSRSRTSRHVSGSGSTATALKGPSRAQSYASARRVPLPGSEIGGVSKPKFGVDVDADEVLNDDEGSVAPSDSISCVGRKQSRRSRH